MKGIFRFFPYKIFLKIPKDKDYVIFADNLHEYFFRYFGKNKCFVIKKKEIYLPALIKAINLNNFFNLKLNYYINLITKINPKLVLTFDSYNEIFYKFKSYLPSKIKTIVVQKTPLLSEFRLFKHDRKKNFCDIIFTCGDSCNYKLNKFIKYNNLYNIGSFINNYNYKKIKDIKSNLIILRTHSNFISKSEIFFLKNLSRYIKEKELETFDVLLKNKKNNELKFYFKKFLTQDELKSFNFIWRNGKSNYLSKNRSYMIANSYKNILFDRSGMGYEMLAKNKNVICFNFSNKLNEDFCLKNKKNFRTIDVIKKKKFKKKIFHHYTNYKNFKKRLLQFYSMKSKKNYEIKNLPFYPDKSIFKQKMKNILNKN